MCVASTRGKSYLLTTVYLWCLLHGKKTQAAAPTGIAAANVEIEGTDVRATTIHNLFDLDSEFTSNLDLSKVNHSKVVALMAMNVLLLDEVSMMDIDCWSSIVELLSMIDHGREPGVAVADTFGRTHIILFGHTAACLLAVRIAA